MSDARYVVEKLQMGSLYAVRDRLHGTFVNHPSAGHPYEMSRVFATRYAERLNAADDASAPRYTAQMGAAGGTLAPMGEKSGDYVRNLISASYAPDSRWHVEVSGGHVTMSCPFPDGGDHVVIHFCPIWNGVNHG